MRIDLPQCNLKNCRKCFDGNCTDKVEYERCEFAHYKDLAEQCRLVELPITKLAHYEDLAEKGLLVELPCKVGDSVYFIKSYFSYCKEPIEEKVDRIIITNLVTFKTENRTFCLNDIGTKVFLTQSEAEQALERQG